MSNKKSLQQASAKDIGEPSPSPPASQTAASPAGLSDHAATPSPVVASASPEPPQSLTPTILPLASESPVPNAVPTKNADPPLTTEGPMSSALTAATQNEEGPHPSPVATAASPEPPQSEREAPTPTDAVPTKANLHQNAVHYPGGSWVPAASTEHGEKANAPAGGKWVPKDLINPRKLPSLRIIAEKMDKSLKAGGKIITLYNDSLKAITEMKRTAPKNSFLNSAANDYAVAVRMCTDSGTMVAKRPKSTTEVALYTIVNEYLRTRQKRLPGGVRYFTELLQGAIFTIAATQTALPDSTFGRMTVALEDSDTAIITSPAFTNTSKDASRGFQQLMLVLEDLKKSGELRGDMESNNKEGKLVTRVPLFCFHTPKKGIYMAPLSAAPEREQVLLPPGDFICDSVEMMTVQKLIEKLRITPSPAAEKEFLNVNVRVCSLLQKPPKEGGNIGPERPWVHNGEICYVVSSK